MIGLLIYGIVVLKMANLTVVNRNTDGGKNQEQAIRSYIVIACVK